MRPPEGVDHEFRQVLRQAAAEKGEHMAVHHRSEKHRLREIKVEIGGERTFGDGALEQLEDLDSRRLHHAGAPRFGKSGIARRIGNEVRHDAILPAGPLSTLPAIQNRNHIVAVVARLQDGRGVKAGGRGKHFQAKCVLIAPMFVDSGLANAGRGGDGIHARRVDSLAGKELQGCFQDLLMSAGAR